MKPGIVGWLSDTLAKRLFWLMACALVVSHFAAYLSVVLVRGQRDLVTAIERAPPVRAMPPLGGLPPRPADNAEGPGSPPDDGPARPQPRHGPRGLTPELLALDYAVRFTVIGLFAWFGSRWLARPMGRLVAASQRLGGTLPRGAAPPQIDESDGSREVREAARVFNRMSRELKQQFDARGLMISAISHDLRTPLTRLRMRLETSEADPALVERSAADIREMDSLIDSVLELFRGYHDATPPQRTDVGALVQSVIDDLAEQGAAVSGRCASALALVHPMAVQRVVGNLVGNALRYGVRARVAVASDAGEGVRITIDDDGPGIAEAQLEAVFEPFFRVESSRSRQSGGTGLGLYIARELTRRQGGELRLSNRPEGGLRAEVTLPRAVP